MVYWQLRAPTPSSRVLQLPVKTMPRRMLTQEDLAWIEELTLQIGPASAAMKRVSITQILASQ